jgi:hypothetical protein
MRKGTNKMREVGDREVHWVEEYVKQNSLSSVGERKTGCIVVF